MCVVHHLPIIYLLDISVRCLIHSSLRYEKLLDSLAPQLFKDTKVSNSRDLIVFF